MTEGTPFQPQIPKPPQAQAVKNSAFAQETHVQNTGNPPEEVSPANTAVQQEAQSQQAQGNPGAYVPPQYHTPQSDSIPYGSNPPPQGGIPEQQTYQNYYPAPPPGYQQKSRIAAGVLALLYGVFGVHNFYLENRSRGVIQLLCSTLGGLLTCGVLTAVIMIWAFVEGILIFVGNDKYIYDGNNVVLRD